jgi:hypothetical protein
LVRITLTGPERIANSERYLDMAKANNQRAEDKANELKQLNKSIFRPVIVWNKVSLEFSLVQLPLNNISILTFAGPEAPARGGQDRPTSRDGARRPRQGAT